MTEMVNLDAIKDKLRQVDVLSGLLGPAARADFESVCEELAINDVADLVGEVERLRELNARQVALVEQARSERDASDAEVERLQEGLERVEGMAERPVCICGVPTGTAAIKQAARAALAPHEPRND